MTRSSLLLILTLVGFITLQIVLPSQSMAAARSVENIITSNDTVCVDQNGDGIIEDNEPCSDDSVPDSASNGN